MARREFVFAALIVIQAAQAQTVALACGDLANSYGPYDYRTDRDKLPIVDNHHFTPQVELLIRGISGPLGAELDYVLRAFPNHHRALHAMTRLAERAKWELPDGAKFDVDCYYERALRFRPDDVTARLLYVAYLGKRSRRDEALEHLAHANAAAGDSGFFHYNIGLQYLEFNEPGKAAEHARRAQSLGVTRTELINRLRAAGHWSEALPAIPASAASSSR